MYKMGTFKRVFSLFLAVLLFVTAGSPGYVYASDSGETSVQTTEKVEEGVATPDEPSSEPEPTVSDGDLEGSEGVETPKNPTDIIISLEWKDSEFKNGDSFAIVEDMNTSNAVTLKVSYNCEKIRPEGYKPGELIISVKGIGAVNRNGVIEAMVGADKKTDTVKNRDWSYTWNKANDTYTFTNNNEIAPNAVMSGYFEMLWNVGSRNSVHGYTQDNVSASMILPDGSSVSSNSLTFSNSTLCDVYTVDIEKGLLYSSSGVNGGLSDEDYAFVKYTLTSSVDIHSRGTSREKFTFVSKMEDGSAYGIITYGTVPYRKNSDGSYTVELKNNVTAGTQYVVVAFPKEGFVGNPVYGSISVSGSFHEGDDAGNIDVNLLDKDEVTFILPPDFDFKDTGGDYHEIKNSYYEYMELTNSNFRNEVTKRGGHLVGKKMLSGTVEEFLLGISMEGYDAADGQYSFELVEDFMYITQNNGDYRQLTGKDYCFERIVITSTKTINNENGVPIRSGVYPVKVYAVQNDAVMVAEESTLVWEGLWMDYEQEVVLPEGTTAFVLRYENLCEGVWGDFSGCQVHDDCVCSSPCARIYTRFLLSESELDEEFKSNLVDGQLVNTIFTNLYNEEGVLTNTDNSEWDYLDEDINIDLAQKDLDTYGRYLDRDRGVITFYEGEKSDYKSTTTLGNIVRNGNKFTAEMTMGASFNFKEEDTPNKFSLYTVLPSQVSLEGYRIEEDLWSIMTLSGFDLSEEVIAAHCTADVVSDYNGSGRTYLALHFDFSDVSIPQESEISAKFDVKIDRKFFDKSKSTVNVRSAILLDSDANIYEIGKSADNGKWDVDANISADIDGDGNALELLSSSYDWSSYTYVDSSQLQMTKSIKTTTTDDYVQLPTVPLAEMGRGYSYEITLRNGSSEADGIVITDMLETGANSEWVGMFNGVDLSEAEKLGLSGTVWYSSKSNPGDLDSGDWSTSLPNNEVRSVAIDFGDSRLEAGKELNIYINMIAPTDKDLVGKITENGYSISFSMYDAVTGNSTKYDELASNFVQAVLSNAVVNIIVSKVDEVSEAGLSGATLSLVNTLTGEEVGRCETNSKGQAIFKNIPADGNYIVKELKAPYGYNIADDVWVSINDYERNQYVFMEDPRILGVIEVSKFNGFDTSVPVAGATYTLYDINGTQVDSKVTNNEGKASFENVQWGKYIIKETASPNGFSLNETEYEVEVSRESVSEVHHVVTDDVQDNVSVTLVKFVTLVSGEKTRDVLPGATFELIRKFDGGEKSYGLYITDQDGKIEISELPYGEYYLREYRAPQGYTAVDDVEFSLSPDKKSVRFPVYNQRKPGSLSVTKSDNMGNFVSGVEFTLYAEDKTTVVATATTDGYGVAQFSGLEWGNYFLKETYAPEYYEINSEWVSVSINSSSLNVTKGVVNETKKGSVRLLKTDESGTISLSGAKYALYTAGGEIIGEYVTNDEGYIVVEDLEWGSYFFKEIEPPEGYGLSNEMIRFSVNAINAGVEQPLFATDPVDAKYATVVKRVRADDINFANGNPSFVFKLSGTDINGIEHTYHSVVTFTEEYVKDNTNEDGFVSQSILFTGLIAGEYSAVELDTSRYILEGISDVINGSVSRDSVVFDLITYNEASAVFTNVNYEHQNYSDSQNLMNIVKLKRRYTSLKAVYSLNSVEAESFVNPDLLTVTAGYDDGTYKVIEDSDYTMSISQFPNVNGEYTVSVSHEEGGITKVATFTVSLYGMKTRIIGLKAENGYATFGSALNPRNYSIIAVYNDGREVALDPNMYTFSKSIAPDYACTFDITVSLDLEVVPNDGFGVETVMSITVEEMPTLTTGANFSSRLNTYQNTSKILTFSSEVAPDGVTLIDVSNANDGSIVAWSDDNGGYIVSTQKPGLGMYANANSKSMFSVDEGGYEFTSIANSIKGGHFLDTSRVTNMAYMCAGCELDSLDFASTWDTSNVTNMEGIFISSGITDVSPISDWDVSSVVTMKWAFKKSDIVSADPLNSWDVSSVSTFRDFFYSCSSLKSADLSNWRPNPTEMFRMFYGCKNLVYVDLSNFNTSGVTSLDNFFWQCSSLVNVNLSNWNISNVTSTYGMFYQCSSLTELNLSSWNTSKITQTGYMFRECSRLKTIYVSDLWSMDSVTTSDSMFTSCTSLVGSMGSSFTEYKIKTSSMAHIDGGTENPGYLSSIIVRYGYIDVGESRLPYIGCPVEGSEYTVTGYSINSGSGIISLNQETGSVTGLSEGTASVLVSIKLPSGTTYDVVTTVYVGDYVCAVYSKDDDSLCFYNPEGDLVSGDEYNGKSASCVFWFNQDEVITSSTNIPWNAVAGCVKKVSFVDEIEPASTAFWFWMFGACETVDLANLNTENAQYMKGMFYQCSSLKSVDLSMLNTSNVTLASYMFSRCTNLRTVCMPEDMSSVTDISYIFDDCKNLSTLDINCFNGINANGTRAFSGCSRLKTIFATDNVDLTGSSTFTNCNLLKGSVGTEYSSEWEDATYARVDKDNDPGYFSIVSFEDYCLAFNQSAMPVMSYTLSGVTIDRFELLSGDCVSLNESTGEVQGVFDGTAKVRVHFRISNPRVHQSYGYADACVYVGDYITAVLAEDSSTFSLNFYRSRNDIVAGDTLDCGVVKHVFTFKEDIVFKSEEDVPWQEFKSVVNKITFVQEVSPVSLQYWFKGMYVGNSNLSLLNTSKVTSMVRLFEGCTGKSLDLSNFDTSNVTSMSGMFYECIGLSNLDLSNFDTSNVTNMWSMFYNCVGLERVDLSNFDTSNVTNMGSMFYKCGSLVTLDLSSFNTQSITNDYYNNMESMFGSCGNLKTIYVSSFWNPGSDYMFSDCLSLVGQNGTVFNKKFTDSSYAVVDNTFTPGYMSSHVYVTYNGVIPVGGWTTPNLQLSEGFTLKCFEVVSGGEFISLNPVTGDVSGLSEGISVIKVSASSPSGAIFEYSARVFVGKQSFAVHSSDGVLYFYKNSDVVKVGDTYNGQTVSNIFYDIENSDFSSRHWHSFSMNYSKPTGYIFVDEISPISTYMWFKDYKGSLDLSKLNTSRTTDMSYMFYNCVDLSNKDLSSLDTSNVTNMTSMFYDGDFTGVDLSNWNTSSLKSMSSMFYLCNLADLDFSTWDTSNVTNMSGAFIHAYNNSGVLDLRSFDTSNVTSMHETFLSCRFDLLDISTWDTSNVTTMAEMFSFADIEVVRMDSATTESLQNADEMFYYARSMTTVYASSKFKISSNVSAEKIFYECDSIVGGFGTNSYNKSKYYARIDLPGNPGVFTFPASVSYDNGVIPLGTTIFPSVSTNDNIKVSRYSIVSGADFVDFNEETGELTAKKDGTVELEVIFAEGSSEVVLPLTIYAGSFVCAVYSSTDYSLEFHKLDYIVKNGDTLNGKYVTKVYTGFEYSNGSSAPWKSHASLIRSVSFVDEISPYSTDYWFYNFTSCENYDLSLLNTSNVISMNYMFARNKSASSLDLTNFDTKNVVSMSNMFADCTSLKYIFVSNGWSVSACSESSNMFKNCFILRGGCGTAFDLNVTDATYARVDSNESGYGYLTEGVSAYYKLVKVGRSSSPITATNTGYTISGYELISGSEYVDLEEDGTVTGKSEGSAIIRVHAVYNDEAVYIDTVCNVVVNLPTEPVILESEHNPYPNSLNEKCYGVANFEGAVSLTVVLEYAKELYGDTFYIYNSEGVATQKGYGSSGVTETLVVPGDFFTITFSTNPAGNEYYGFRAVVTPNYPVNFTVDNQCPDDAAVEMPDSVTTGSVISLVPVKENTSIASFKLNGELVTGDSFTVEGDGVGVITDVVLVECVVIESEHNPYPNSVSSVSYGTAQFAGASSLKVTLEYQTESTNYDWIYLYDSEGNIFNNKKYGGTTRTTVELEIPGDFVNVVFKTDGSGNNYYGFKATIYPVYPEAVELVVDNQCPDFVSVNLPETVYSGMKIELTPATVGSCISSFKLNGELVSGNSFNAPTEDATVVITDVVLLTSMVVESAHNPYPNSVNSVTYGEVEFWGVDSLTVVLDCETESSSYDWVYLYDADGNIVGNKKYGGSRQTVTITVPGNYVKVVFRSDSSVNSYYGFKATITPNLPEESE